MTERERIFRDHEPSRAWLESVLKNPIFKEAVEIMREQRTINETSTEVKTLSNDGMISTRMNSQRVGMEGVFLYLSELTMPNPPPSQDIPPDYNEPEAYRQTHE